MKAPSMGFKSVGIAILLLVARAGPAVAQTCNFSITNLNFGSIDVTANAAITTTGTYTATCSALLTATRTCPSIAAGTGGSSSGSPRYLLSGANQLSYNLFSDSSYASIWGSYFWGFPYLPPSVDIQTIVLGNGNTSAAVYARIPNGQQTLPAGTYTSSFAGANTRVTYGAYALGLFPPNCATLSSPSGTALFTVTATIVPNCNVSATNLDFGITGTISGNKDAANNLNITCTAQTPYSISLDGGTSGASDPTQRRMKKGSESVVYGLYRDAARSLLWGNTIGTNTLSATGSGLVQAITVYGRVRAQATPSPGTYSDTIVVTLTY
jgi:spore coat protein U-like protein